MISNDTKFKKEESLFPELSPYGVTKPLPLKAPEYPTELPVKFVRKPSVSERELTIASTPTLDTTIPTVSVGHEVLGIDAPKRTSKKLIVCTLIFLILAGVTALTYRSLSNRRGTKVIQTSTYTQPTDPAIKIPVYFPVKLPAGYVYDNNPNILKDKFYYSVTGPGGQVFYITEQPIPANFDFASYNKKFTTPHSFHVGAGTVVAGKLGINYTASIKTDNNSWIIINSLNPNSQAALEIVAESLTISK